MNPFNLFWLIPVALAFSYLVNYFADIMPLGKGLVKYNCSACNHPYTFFDYVLFRRCQQCHKRLSIRHWVVLLLSVSAPVLLAFFPPGKSLLFPFFTYVYLFLFFYFMLVFIIDLEHREILYFLCAIGFITASAVGIWIHQQPVFTFQNKLNPLFNGLINSVLGCIVGSLFMLALYGLGKLFTLIVYRIQKKEVGEVALGFGDVLLAAILGVLLGYPGIFACLIISILLGGLFSLLFIVIMRIKGKFKAFTAIPYAPFMIVSAMVLLYIAK